MFEIRRSAGFAEPITVAASSSYFDMFDENRLHSEPSKVIAAPIPQAR